MGWLERIAERMMLKARAEGKLTGIEGKGRPRPDRPIETDSTAAGFRIMAQAGVLPPEIVLKKQVIAARARLSDMPEGPERAALLAEIARLQMRQAIAEEARRRFMRD
ncbi:DnaJ family domain-containing protein [Paracoccus marcusii]|uniref:DnaJ family domain-containing protein n=1 Tax=Paracoccus marcusii TaxID=59779 RepID=UPI002ED33D54|nr:DnaJ family domain-containing protein [Paracoccus marcusii]